MLSKYSVLTNATPALSRSKALYMNMDQKILYCLSTDLHWQSQKLEESCKKITDIWSFVNACLISLCTLIRIEGKSKLPSVYQLNAPIEKIHTSLVLYWKHGKWNNLFQRKGTQERVCKQGGRGNRKYRTLVTDKDLVHFFFSCPTQQRKLLWPKMMKVLHRAISPSTLMTPITLLLTSEGWSIWHLSSVLC